MNDKSLLGKTILITGAAHRIGKIFALGCAQAGADLILHHGHSHVLAESTRDEIEALGGRAWILAADFEKPAEASELIAQANNLASLYALVNSAAIFEPLSVFDAALTDWERHLSINLTAPFLLSQAFAKQMQAGEKGRIVNILDWRATRPGADHFPYSISKAALAAMTKSLALALAPNISVNGLALGAILSPSDGEADPELIKKVPLKRWGEAKDIQHALVYLLAGPEYITGEIIYVDGDRHLV